MKLQRTTLVLVLVAAVLGGLVYVLERQDSRSPAAPTAQSTPIFSFQEEQIQAVTVQTTRLTLALVKGMAPSPNPSRKSGWQLQAPIAAPASDAAVAYLLNLLATAKSTSTLTVPNNRLAEFGLVTPLARVEVKLNNQQTHRLILGQPNFNRSALYAQVDPPAATTPDQQILLVPVEFENAVNRPLSEWQAEPQPVKPPIKKSPDPSPTPRTKTNATVRPNQR